jgi:hypothetical protein
VAHVGALDLAGEPRERLVGGALAVVLAREDDELVRLERGVLVRVEDPDGDALLGQLVRPRLGGLAGAGGLEHDGPRVLAGGPVGDLRRRAARAVVGGGRDRRRGGRDGGGRRRGRGRRALLGHLLGVAGELHQREHERDERDQEQAADERDGAAPARRRGDRRADVGAAL